MIRNPSGFITGIFSRPGRLVAVLFAAVLVVGSIGAAAACPAQIMRQFLTAPDHAVDAACVAAHYTAAWVLPAQE